MRLIRLTLIIHLLLHSALWLPALALVLAAVPDGGLAADFYQVMSGALIIHLGSYHWAMTQWHEDLCDGRAWAASIWTALIALGLGVIVLLFPALGLYAVVLAVVLLVWQESWGRMARYIQPWYLRLRWLQMISLVLTQLLMQLG